MDEHDAPTRTPINPLTERILRWINRSESGQAFGHWLGKLVALPQLGRLAASPIPWTPLSCPIASATVAIVTTSGVHLTADKPFLLDSDSSFRVLPRDAKVADLTITHQAYDRTDALRDINLVFPLERLRELEAEGVIGQVADEHFGFGFCRSAKALLAPGREVARRLAQAHVDLVLLVPA
ncbi:MAG TPA: glycine/sarcosine/betaine reductase selenoprotein B family protein [Ktedonosporobacter sp.]|nr:glycine/sarcosine/betaine reductase selenoprotein B family protein [Ktedonosporobacter sp.]